MFSIEFSKLLSIDMILNQTVKMPAFVDACECKITSRKQSISTPGSTQNSRLVF